MEYHPVSRNHYFSSKPSSKDKRAIIDTILRGNRYRLLISQGVFSSKRIDNGTRILVENMIIPTEGDFLDIGCGIGVIGLVAAIESPKLKIHLSDVNPRAVNLTRLNVERLSLKNCSVYEGNLYEPLQDMVFDAIVSNPPVSAGMHNVVYPMVSGAYERLVDGGLLQMVIQTNKGGKMLAGFLDEVFGSHMVLARKSGYRVLSSVKR
jgi:16S rRNA (guanine1207-N2)-methyltransferase